MITCKECVFWSKKKIKHDYQAEDIPSFGGCLSEKWRTGQHLSETQPEKDWLDPEMSLDEIWVEDDEDWAFYTGPDFGCIHASAKEKE